MVFNHPVRLDTVFAGPGMQRDWTLSELLTHGLVYVTDGCLLGRFTQATTVHVTWPPAFTMLMTNERGHFPSLLSSPSATRQQRNPSTNEEDDLCVLMCRYRLLSWNSGLDSPIALGHLLPSLQDPRHALHDAAGVFIKPLPQDALSLSLFFRRVQYDKQLEMLRSRGVPAAFMNAPQASFADSFLIVELAYPTDPAVEPLCAPVGRRMTMRSSAAALPPASASTFPSHLIIFISSKSHVTKCCSEDVDAEVAKVSAAFRNDAPPSAWLLLHITDAEECQWSEIYQNHTVVIQVPKKEYDSFAGSMAAAARRRFTRSQAALLDTS